MEGMNTDLATQTRDLAVRADAKTDAHLADCAAYRLRLADELKTMKKDISADTVDIKNDIAEVKGDVKEVKEDLKKQTRTITLITGGIITLSKAPDLLGFLQHLIH